MKDEKLFEKVKELLASNIDDESLIQNMELDSSLTKDLDINSAYIIDVVLDFEEAFGIEISDDMVTKMETVEDIMNILKSLKVTV